MSSLARYRLIHIIRRAWVMPRSRKIVLGEGVIRVMIAWFMIRFVPYRRWSHQLGQRSALPDLGVPGAPPTAFLRDLAWVMNRLRSFSGERFTCLMLALAARAMLHARGTASHLVLGVERRPNLTRREPFGAHAWVIVESVAIVGGEGSERFTPVAAFGPYEAR
jgi:Transglutaminase-like superfamily